VPIADLAGEVPGSAHPRLRRIRRDRLRPSHPDGRRPGDAGGESFTTQPCAAPHLSTQSGRTVFAC